MDEPKELGWTIICPDCGKRDQLGLFNWRCDCGGAWEFVELPVFDADKIERSEHSLWRYAATWPTIPHEHSLGFGRTPLTSEAFFEIPVYLKSEYVSPTGSYKDRGSEVMVSFVAAQGTKEVVEDSSGNAGASIAGYAAKAGLKAHIFVPSSASPAKLAQIKAYGAQIHTVEGPRVNAKNAAVDFVNAGHVFASHAYHPAFLLGLTTLAFEIWEQLGNRAPDVMILPVGQGVHFLGAWHGFRRLYEARLISRVPRMIGVQPSLLNPIKRALDGGLDYVPAMEPGEKSLAEGLAITHPVRGKRILQAIRETGGTMIDVTEDEIRSAHKALAGRGYYVEPSSATAVAALAHLRGEIRAGETVVMPLTGSGLKSPLIDPDTK